MIKSQATSSEKAIIKSEAIENPISIDLIEPHLYLGLYNKTKTIFLFGIIIN